MLLLHRSICIYYSLTLQKRCHLIRAVKLTHQTNKRVDIHLDISELRHARDLPNESQNITHNAVLSESILIRHAAALNSSDLYRAYTNDSPCREAAPVERKTFVNISINDIKISESGILNFLGHSSHFTRIHSTGSPLPAEPGFWKPRHLRFCLIHTTCEQ